MEGDSGPVLLADVEQYSSAGDVEDKSGCHR